MQLSQSVSLPTSGLSQFLNPSLRNRLLGVALSLGLAVSGMCSTIVHAADMSSMPQNLMSQTVSASTATTIHATPSKSGVLIASGLPANGVYLYGQSPNRDQLGRTYLVFEVSQNRVVGAFYMPNSSLDCFSGAINANKLALTVVDSYDRTPHPYALALSPNAQVAGSNPGVAGLNLAGYHHIGTLSANDQRILGVCKADMQK